MTTGTYPIQAHAVKIGHHILIEEHPCRISAVSHHKTGKHGHAKCGLAGYCLVQACTSRHETMCAGHLLLQAFHPTREEFQVCSIEPPTTLTIFKADGNIDTLDLADKALMKAYTQNPDAGDYWVTVLSFPYKDDLHKRLVAWKVI